MKQDDHALSIGNYSSQLIDSNQSQDMEHTEDEVFWQCMNPEHHGVLLAEVIPGVVHQVSNLLMEINGQAILADLALSQHSESKKYMTRLTHSCQNLTNLLKKIAVLSRHNLNMPHECDLDHCLDKTIKTVNNQFPEINISISEKHRESLVIRGDPLRLRYCFQFICEALWITYPNQSITIQTNVETPISNHSALCKILSETQWTKLQFQSNTSPLSPPKPIKSFYNPDDTFEFSACLLAAAESIVQAYNGRFEIDSTRSNVIGVYLPVS